MDSVRTAGGPSPREWNRLVPDPTEGLPVLDLVFLAVTIALFALVGLVAAGVGRR